MRVCRRKIGKRKGNRMRTQRSLSLVSSGVSDIRREAWAEKTLPGSSFLPWTLFHVAHTHQGWLGDPDPHKSLAHLVDYTISAAFIPEKKSGDEVLTA